MCFLYEFTGLAMPSTFPRMSLSPTIWRRYATTLGRVVPSSLPASWSIDLWRTLLGGFVGMISSISSCWVCTLYASMPPSGNSSIPDSSLGLLLSTLAFFGYIVILLLLCSCLVLMTMISSGFRLLDTLSYLRA